MCGINPQQQQLKAALLTMGLKQSETVVHPLNRDTSTKDD